MPLHIFEPRYRQLLADCLAGDREFGIIFRPEDVAERELAPGHVGCVARVETTQPLPDGRANVIVRGVERFALVRFVERDVPYHVAEVCDFGDAPEPLEGREPLEALAGRVRRAFERVGRAAHALADESTSLPELPADPAQLSFTIASMIDLDATRRQRLLASRSATERLRDLDTLLTPAVATLELRAAVHARAKQNGRGPGASA
jgi:Lon protease-like protein